MLSFGQFTHLQLLLNTAVVEDVEEGIYCRIQVQQDLFCKAFEVSVVEEDEARDGDVADVDESETDVDGVAENGS